MNDPGSWRAAPAPFSEVRRLADDLGVSEVLAQVLVRRGMNDVDVARAFLHPDYRVNDPYRMHGMAEARERIDRALQRGEPVAVHGDYDADGITATFLLCRMLEELGADVRWRLPNRFSEGYGVSTAAVDELAEAGVRLLVTVDCGVNARAEVAHAQALGMDVVVTDHHELEGELPACTVVSPRLGEYPCRHLAGVGVAFKLAHALLEDPPGTELVDVPLALRPYTDLVAVGTIADVVPLIEENRVLTAIGLGRLRSAPRPGLAALLEVAGGRPDAVDAGAVGFRLGPRLNAAGRLEDASLALDLLASGDRETALPLALKLNELNRERQTIEAAMLQEAVAMVPDPPPAALVLSSPNWHEGVVGIVASRLAERFHRPTILLSEGEDEAKGSGRSIPAFDLLGAVESCAEHLTAFGGHRAACGLRLRRASIPAFREAFVGAAEATLTADDLRRVRQVDAVVGGDELSLGLVDELELLAPHGFGNRQVTLLLHAAEIVAPRLTRDKRHAQYRVRCDGASCQAVQFNFDQIGGLTDGRHDVALALTKNEFKGAVSAQVQVRSLHRIEAPATDLCSTACATACRDRLCGEGLWAELLGGAGDGEPRHQAEAASPDTEDAGGALHAARAAGRVVDRRGRPAVSQLAALVAHGEPVLVLTADVARRRPLLTRDLPVAAFGVSGAYVHSACRHRLAEAPAHGVVLTTPDLALDHADLTRGFAHVALLDPPFTTGVWASLAAAAPNAYLHALWGPAEASFAERVRVGQLDLGAVARRVWKVLSGGHGRFDDALEQELLGRDAVLAPVSALVAAFAVLREAGLLVAGADGGYDLERPQEKVDVTRTEAYRRWLNRYQTPDFLPTCLTARL